MSEISGGNSSQVNFDARIQFYNHCKELMNAIAVSKLKNNNDMFLDAITALFAITRPYIKKDDREVIDKQIEKAFLVQKLQYRQNAFYNIDYRQHLYELHKTYMESTKHLWLPIINNNEIVSEVDDELLNKFFAESDL